MKVKLPSTLISFPVTETKKTPHSMIFPTPCFTVETENTRGILDVGLKTRYWSKLARVFVFSTDCGKP